jgi:hypothetical protein
MRVQGGALETAGVLARRSEWHADAVTLLLVAGRLRELTDTAQAALAEAQAELPATTLAAVTDAAASMSVARAIELTLENARSIRTGTLA